MTLPDGTPLSPALGIGAFAEQTLVAAGQATKVDPRPSGGRGPARLRRDGRARRGDVHGRASAGATASRCSAAAVSATPRSPAPACRRQPDHRRRHRRAQARVGAGVRRDAHRELARHRPGRGDPRAHGRARRRRLHRGGRPARGARAGVLRARPRGHASCRSGVPDPTMRIELPMIEFFGRGGALKPSWYGDCLPSRDFPMLIDLYLDGRLDLDALRERDHRPRRHRGRVPQDGARRGAALRRRALASRSRSLRSRAARATAHDVRL